MQMETARVVLYHVIRSSADMCHCCWQPPPRSPHLSAVTCRLSTSLYMHRMYAERRSRGAVRCVCVSAHTAHSIKVRPHRTRAAAAGWPSREVAAVCDLVTPDSAVGNRGGLRSGEERSSVKKSHLVRVTE